MQVMTKPMRQSTYCKVNSKKYKALGRPILVSIAVSIFHADP